MNYREAMLKGAKQAGLLHRQLRIEDTVDRSGGRIDVCDVVRSLNSKMVFRPLTGLLGAFIRDGERAGILVTTERRLPIQRFTTAHELGHFFMGHQISVDGDEILGGQTETGSLEEMEIEANGFAAEFLAPRWLLAYHAQRQGWDRDALGDAAVAYQLSLRLGLSFEATCRSLRNHQIIEPEDARRLLDTKVKDVKRALLPDDYTPPAWYGDVWVLTEKDRGGLIEGHADDHFVLKLHEKSAAGYLWDLASLKEEGFEIFADHRAKLSESTIGGETVREVTAGGAKQFSGQILMAQRRPWQSRSAAVAELSVNYDLNGKESGLPRAFRRKLQAA